MTRNCRPWFIALAAVAALGLLAACGGGGGSVGGTGSPPPAGAPTPRASACASPGTTSATFTFLIPAALQQHGRAPQYVSVNATSATIVLVSVNGGPPPACTATTIASLTGAACQSSAGVRTCSVAAPAVPGTDVFSLSVTDSAGDVLGIGGTTVGVTAGVANSGSVTLSGIVAALTLALPSGVTANVPAAAPAVVTAADASGATITGPAPFASPVALADIDPSGATTLYVNGTASSTLRSPADVVTVRYSGLAIVPPTITATVSYGAATVSATATLAVMLAPIVTTGTQLDALAPTDPNYRQPTLYVNALGASAAFSAAESGWSNAPFGKTFTATLDQNPSDAGYCNGTGPAAIATVTSADNLTFTVTGQHPGYCKITLADGAGQSLAVWASVTTSSIGVR